MCAMEEGFSKQGICKTRPETGVRHTGDMVGLGPFWARRTSTSEDSRWQESAECTGGIEIGASQCARNRVRRENPRWLSTHGQTEFKHTVVLSPETHYLGRQGEMGLREAPAFLKE